MKRNVVALHGRHALAIAAITLLAACSSDDGGGNDDSTPTMTPTVVMSSPTGTTPPSTPTLVPTAAATFTASPMPGGTDLRITTTDRSTFTVGDEGLYDLDVTNQGPLATDDEIVVTDTLPAGLTFQFVVGANWSCSTAGAVVTCRRTAPLLVDETSSVLIVVGVDEQALPEVTNRATVSYSREIAPADNEATLVTPVGSALTEPGDAEPTDLSMVKTIEEPFRIGSQGVYLLTIENRGPNVTALDIPVVDQLPDGLNIADINAPDWSCTPVSTGLDCTSSEPLGVREQTYIILTVDVTPQVASSVTNVATVSYPLDDITGNNTGQAPTFIRDN